MLNLPKIAIFLQALTQMLNKLQLTNFFISPQNGGSRLKFFNLDLMCSNFYKFNSVLVELLSKTSYK